MVPIAHDEIHVWQTSLPGDQAGLQDYLSSDEVTRANRFVSVEDRTRFIRARAALRSILARYTGADPRLLRFAYGKVGKPLLASQIPGRTLHFSVSHSSDLALIAVAGGFPVGIDLERKRVDLAVDELVAESFSDSERRAIALFCGARRIDAFYKTWTSKEAYLKGIGCGIGALLKDFQVCVDPERPPEILKPLSGEHDGVWFLHPVNCNRNYVATLAARSRNASVVLNNLREIA